MIKQKYNASSIQVLKGLEGVRKRPEMYIGNTDDISGLHHMVYELIDNSIDEVSAGFCNEISVTVYANGWVSVKDNGRGIPVDHHEGENMSAAELIMTQLHAGGKFSKDSYEYSGGLHGVGAAVVVALSAHLDLTVYRDGKEYSMSFAEGKKIKDMTVMKSVDIDNTTGTFIKFLPDPTIFSVVDFNTKVLKSRLEELSFLNPGVTINFLDEKSNASYGFCNSKGLLDFLESLLINKTKIIEPILFSSEINQVKLSLCMSWTKYNNEESLFFTNNIQQKDGGTHVSGFRTGLTRAFQNYIKEKGTKVQQKIEFIGDDIREGMVSILSIKVHDPKFSSQTKEKLVSSNVRQAVESMVFTKLQEWLEENPNDANIVINKILESAIAREAAKKARELSHKQKSNAIQLQVSKKLAACSEKDPSKCELFIVEGDSAGGSAKQARNRFFQAVLPLRGKIMNIEKVNFTKALSSEVISTLVAAIGTGIGDEFDISKLKYHKIIIMTDSDVDGKHISALLLVFFFRYMPELIQNKHLYISTPPLYGIIYKNRIDYIQDDADFYRYMVNRGAKDISISKSDSVILSGDDLKDFLFDTASFSKNLNLHRKENEFLKALICAKAFQYQSRTVITDEINGEFPQDNTSMISIDPSKAYDFLKHESNNWTLHDGILELNENGLQTQHNTNTMRFKNEHLIMNYLDKWSYAWGRDCFVDNVALLDPFRFLQQLIQKASKGLYVQRYKGLGEMNAKELGEVAMCNYKSVELCDITEAEKTCIDLMGIDVTQRKAFIRENAIYADLDS